MARLGTEDKAARFWRWFASRPGRWRLPGEDFDEERLQPIYDRLESLFPELTPVIEWAPEEPFQLVFSLWRQREPAARKQGALSIRLLKQTAPKLKSWRFRAYAERVGWNDAYFPRLRLPNEGRLVIDTLSFVRLPGRQLSVRVFVPGFSAPLDSDFRTAVERILEAGMGEGWVVRKLKRLELEDAAQATPDARPLRELSSPE